jgi:hypothetical protein
MRDLARRVEKSVAEAEELKRAEAEQQGGEEDRDLVGRFR